MSETIAIVDEKDKVIGKDDRKVIHKEGKLHREVYAFIINEKDEMLLTKAWDTKMWDCSAAGHFGWDETYEQGILRELEEEIGIKLAKDDLEEAFKIHNLNQGTNNKFIKLFVIKKTIPLEDFSIDNKEILEIKYLPIKDIKTQIEQSPEQFEERFRIAFKEYLSRS